MHVCISSVNMCVLPEFSRAHLSPGPPSSVCRSSSLSVDLAAGCRRPLRRHSVSRERSGVYWWYVPQADLWGPHWAQTGRREWWGRSYMQGWHQAPGSYIPSTGLRGKIKEKLPHKHCWKFLFQQFLILEALWELKVCLFMSLSINSQVEKPMSTMTVSHMNFVRSPNII